MPNPLRYTMVLDEAAVQSVERLRQAFGLGNKADAYQLAIRVLTWVAEQQANGLEVGRFSTEKDEFQPLLIPYDFKAKVWKEGA